MRRITLIPACLAIILAAGAFLIGASPARAQFEVEEPEAEKGELEFEYQGDYHWGNPRRRVDASNPSEIIADENEVLRQRHVFGLGFGLTDYLRLTVEAEFEQERFDEIDDVASANAFDDLNATEIQFEGVAVLVPLKKNGFALAAYASYVASLTEDPNQFQIGPILKVAQGPWSATANLFFIRNIGGGEREEEDEPIFRDQRWDFQYAWQIKYDYSDRWALAVEGFGTVNRLGDTGRESDAVLEFGDQDQHRLGPVVYYTFKHWRGAEKGSLKDVDDDDKAKAGDDDDDDEGTSVTAGLGVLFGLNDDTSDVALKWSLEVGF